MQILAVLLIIWSSKKNPQCKSSWKGNAHSPSYDTSSGVSMRAKSTVRPLLCKSSMHDEVTPESRLLFKES